MTVTMSDKDTGSVAIVWGRRQGSFVCDMQWATIGRELEIPSSSLLAIYYYALTDPIYSSNDPIYSSNLGERT